MQARPYVQSNMLSYFLGTGMDDPGQPDVRYIGEAALDEAAVYGIRNVNSGRIIKAKGLKVADVQNILGFNTPQAIFKWKA